MTKVLKSLPQNISEVVTKEEENIELGGEKAKERYTSSEKR